MIRISREQRGFAVGLQEICKHWISVQWNMAEDVVKDVRFWQVVERFLRTNHHRRWKLSARKAREESSRGQIARHGSALPSSQLLQEVVDALWTLQVGNVIAHEVDRLRTREIHA